MRVCVCGGGCSKKIAGVGGLGGGLPLGFVSRVSSVGRPPFTRLIGCNVSA